MTWRVVRVMVVAGAIPLVDGVVRSSEGQDLVAHLVASAVAAGVAGVVVTLLGRGSAAPVRG